MNSTDIVVFGLLAVGLFAYFKRETLKELLSSDDSDIAVTTGGSRDIAQIVRDNNKNYLVLFASQTGTAEDYAKKFAKELAAKFSLNVMCGDVENYDFETLNELPENCIVSIFISTYGEGDFPDGAINFEEFLSNAADVNSLPNVNFTLFGLGNSTYEFYNGAAGKALKHLEAAGASIIGPYGQGDDGAGTTDEDYMSWKDAVMELLKDQLKLDEHEQTFTPSFKYEPLSSISEETSLGEPSFQYLPVGKLSFNDAHIQLGPYDLSHPFVAPIVKSNELFTSADRNCIHSEIDISGSNMKYSTGDHLGIWPSNANEKVEQFLSTFGLDSNTIFDLKPLDSTVKLPFPVPTTIGAAVRNYMEITGPVPRNLFASLVQFAPNDELKEKLTSLSQDKDLFAKEVTAKYLNLADALLQLSNGEKWSTVPWEFLIEAIPHLNPRYYSISSSALSEKQVIHITSVVENSENPTGSGPRVLGVATNLLRNIELVENKEDESTLPIHYDLTGPRKLFSGFKLPVHVRRSTFRLPTNPSTPVLMIGPGTGVAPFRGFIRERVAYVQTQENVKLGKHLLFYGSRDTHDYLYKEEWPEYSKKLDGSFEMVVCHSRLPNVKKVYVQDKLRERASDVYQMIKDGAFIYVCGDAGSMAKGVSSALVDILSKEQSISTEDACEMIKMLKTSGRYQEDIW
ncbi:hypothetical protein Kpol_1051p8 [Vanderwaltozyma polyspora DSM 70294]|uniref:NADPH--cytochrome P450 reductase n=1 Tax=Vanderwaltozyma polyspora (strain ATCC 22028 / DSM 70294 / BCRC 21397 / CBS 2163 / NBRC 10782 / NRRL Y-8283 / UCD 57-17) TaxID=436907 RepID=A7TMX2_VANPO|nr:uncharacterized protein Kpol_1051p8 [Vanderwaltozyma polyspora DSM 70294]EDO16360.1 hypothetical protein Kpol_1051p8 [Vanderwaltozyma polyspora DSM 70294]